MMGSWLSCSRKCSNEEHVEKVRPYKDIEEENQNVCNTRRDSVTFISENKNNSKQQNITGSKSVHRSCNSYTPGDCSKTNGEMQNMYQLPDKNNETIYIRSNKMMKEVDSTKRTGLASLNPFNQRKRQYNTLIRVDVGPHKNVSRSSYPPKVCQSTNNNSKLKTQRANTNSSRTQHSNLSTKNQKPRHLVVDETLVSNDSLSEKSSKVRTSPHSMETRGRSKSLLKNISLIKNRQEKQIFKNNVEIQQINDDNREPICNKAIAKKPPINTQDSNSTSTSNSEIFNNGHRGVDRKSNQQSSFILDSNNSLECTSSDEKLEPYKILYQEDLSEPFCLNRVSPLSPKDELLVKHKLIDNPMIESMSLDANYTFENKDTIPCFAKKTEDISNHLEMDVTRCLPSSMLSHDYNRATAVSCQISNHSAMDVTSYPPCEKLSQYDNRTTAVSCHMTNNVMNGPSFSKLSHLEKKTEDISNLSAMDVTSCPCCSMPSHHDNRTTVSCHMTNNVMNEPSLSITSHLDNKNEDISDPTSEVISGSNSDNNADHFSVPILSEEESHKLDDSNSPSDCFNEESQTYSMTEESEDYYEFLNKIDNMKKEASQYEVDIENYKLSPNPRTCYYIEESLVRIQLRLDKLHVDYAEDLRLKRKEVIKYINQLLRKLDLYTKTS